MAPTRPLMVQQALLARLSRPRQKTLSTPHAYAAAYLPTRPMALISTSRRTRFAQPKLAFPSGTPTSPVGRVLVEVSS